MTPEEEDHLLVDAIALAMDVRDDLPQAHRTIRSLERFRLEQVCCALAAMVDPNIPLSVTAWWRHPAQTQQQPATDTGACGTTAGYKRHLRRSEVACPECKAASAKRSRDRAPRKAAA